MSLIEYRSESRQGREYGYVMWTVYQSGRHEHEHGQIDERDGKLTRARHPWRLTHPAVYLESDLLGVVLPHHAQLSQRPSQVTDMHMHSTLCMMIQLIAEKQKHYAESDNGLGRN